MKTLPFIKELIEARMFTGPDDLKNKSANQIAEIVFLMFIMIEMVRQYKPDYTATYAVDTLKYNTYENIHYAGTDLGNLLAVLNNQDTFKAYIKTESGVAIPLFQINRYLRDVSSKSKSSHSDDVSFFWRLEDFLKLYGNSLLRQLRRDVGNWKDLTRANKEQIYLTLRREFDKRCSSVDMYLWYKSSFKISESEIETTPNNLNKTLEGAILNEPIIFDEEEETERLDIEENGDWQQRVFFDAFLTKKRQTWLTVPGPTGKVNSGSATLDLDNKTGMAYINRIDVTPTGKGFGSELLKYIVKQAKEHGYSTVKAYTEFTNINSKDMFRKAGFKEIKLQSGGSHWELSII